MEIGRGLVRVAPTSAIVRWSTSFVRECVITDRVGMVLENRDCSLIDVPLIRALDLLPGNLGECDRVSVVEKRVGLTLQGQVCLTLCITCGRDACSSKRRDRQVHALDTHQGPPAPTPNG